MTKKLIGLSRDLSDEPFERLAYYAVIVYRINGHKSEHEEIVRCLKISGLTGTMEEVQKVVDLVPDEVKPVAARDHDGGFE